MRGFDIVLLGSSVCSSKCFPLRLAGQQESILCTLGPTYCLVHFVLESATVFLAELVYPKAPEWGELCKTDLGCQGMNDNRRLAL